MLNLFTMMIYAHSVDFFILMFPCIQIVSIKWIKSNTITLFYVFLYFLTIFYVFFFMYFMFLLILPKCQRQFKLTIAVGGYRFLSFKRRYYSHYFGLFCCDKGHP